MAFRNAENGLWSKLFQQVPYYDDNSNVRIHTNLVLGNGTISVSEGLNSATNVTVSADETNASMSVIQLQVTDLEGWQSYRNAIYTGHISNTGNYNQYSRMVMNADGTGRENVRVSTFDASGRYAPLRYSKDISGLQPLFGTEFEYVSPTQTDMVLRAYDASGVGIPALRILGSSGNLSAQNISVGGIVSVGDVSINGGNTYSDGFYKRIGGTSSDGYTPAVMISDESNQLSFLPKIIAYSQLLLQFTAYNYNGPADGVLGTFFEIPNTGVLTYGTSDDDMKRVIWSGNFRLNVKNHPDNLTIQFMSGDIAYPIAFPPPRLNSWGFLVRGVGGHIYALDELTAIDAGLSVHLMAITPYN